MLTLSIKKHADTRVLEDDAKIIFVKNFDLDSSIEFVKKFNRLNSDKDMKVIPIMILSYGGDCSSLFAMLDTIKTATKPVATIAAGAAMSCGAVLLGAGTKGYRFAGPLAEVMIHEVASMSWGKNTNLVSDTKQISKINKIMFSLLAKFTGKTSKFLTDKIKKAGNVDWYLTAREAKALGLVDYDSMPIMLDA